MIRIYIYIMNDSFSFILKVLSITILVNFVSALIVHDNATILEKNPCPGGTRKVPTFTARMSTLFAQDASVPLASTIKLLIVLSVSLVISTYLHVSL